MELGKIGVWAILDKMSAGETADAAQRIEKMGYAALWLPEAIGRNPLVHAGYLLSQTERLIVATGIANIYNREPGVTVSAQRTLADLSGGRFLLGLGVSHKPLVEGVRGLDYGPPVQAMKTYLDQMKAAPDHHGFGGVIETPTVIAALGPKMLEVAREKALGAHPYFVSPDHTRRARKILGPDRMLCVEQKIILARDASTARNAARKMTQVYLGLPNYVNNWKRLGFSDADLEQGGSDRFIDAMFAWGSAGDIQRRLKEHFDAGASHLCVQAVHPSGVMGEMDWEALEAVAPG